MGQRYEQLSLEERCEIARRRADGQSVRQIAAALDRSPSSVSRELKRNSGTTVDYKPSYADAQAKARRWRGSKLLRNPELQRLVLGHLSRGWSPQQVAGWLKRKHGRTVVSYETIYRFIAAQIARTKDYAWRLYLPRAKSKRGWRGRKGGSAAEHIKDRVSIALRPSTAADRVAPGHWEADLMLFRTYGQAVLALHERSSRALAILRQPGKRSSDVAEAIEAILAALPSRLRQTITFDNGTEFAQHFRLRENLGILTFFCDPHAPWQKGGIENAIGRLRRSLPRKADLAELSPKHFRQLARRYNNTPRKCLDFQTPAEVFLKALQLHFECESTFPLARE
jgi:transposase, IS30 family